MEPDRLAALASEFQAGILTNEELCEKYYVSRSRLSTLVQRNGWVRRVPPTEDKVQPLVHLFSFDPNEQAAMSAAQVVAMHRKDVARLRTISSTLVDRLGIILAGKELKDAEGNQMACLGSRESPADLLEKLSRVMVRTTEIERQAYGLKAFNPEQTATDAELAAELDKLTEDVERIAKEKALQK